MSRNRLTLALAAILVAVFGSGCIEGNTRVERNTGESLVCQNEAELLAGACVCSPGFYGVECANACDCQNDAACDDGVSGIGTCTCAAGYYGPGCGGVCDCPTGVSCHECAGYKPTVVTPQTDSGRYWAHIRAEKVLDAAEGLAWFEVKPSSVEDWVWVTKTPPGPVGADLIDAWVAGLAPGTSHDYRVCNDDGSPEPTEDAVYCSEVISFYTSEPTSMLFVEVDSLDPTKLALEDGERFIPWGSNYVRVDTLNTINMLLEDAMYDPAGLAHIGADFDKLKNIAPGANLNVVRIHLRFHSFLLDPATPDHEALARLANVVEMAEDRGLYLMVTGLSYFFPADNPAWVTQQTTQEAHWTAQEIWWRHVSRALRHSPGVFAYDLVNEPYANSDSRVVDGEFQFNDHAGPTEYCSYGENVDIGKHGICFGQWVTPDGGGESPEVVAAEWTRRMTQAIRYVSYFVNDGNHLITVGVGGAFNMNSPFFSSPEVQDHLDFISPHLYPSSADNGQDKIDLAETLSDYGKPVIVGETFSLGPVSRLISETCNADTTQGWIGQFDGRTMDETCPPTSDPWNCIFFDLWYSIQAEFGPTILAGGCPAIVP